MNVVKNLTRRLLLGLALGLVQAALAHADDCADALNRFDYLAAEALAGKILKAQPNQPAALICLARSQYERGDFPAALSALKQAEGQPMDVPTRVRLGNWFGVTLRKLGQPDAAWRYQQAALQLAQSSSEIGGLATALHNTAGMLYDRGFAEAALAHYRASIPINPDLAERSASLNNMGLIEAERGNPVAAETWLKAAIALNREHNHFHHLGKHLMNLGNLYRGLARFAEAGALIDEGAGLVDKAGDRYWVGWGKRLAGWLARDEGKHELARSKLNAAIIDFNQAGAWRDAESTRAELAELLI